MQINVTWVLVSLSYPCSISIKSLLKILSYDEEYVHQDFWWVDLISIYSSMIFDLVETQVENSGNTVFGSGQVLFSAAYGKKR